MIAGTASTLTCVTWPECEGSEVAPALGEPRQGELAADEGGHGQADKGERAAQHQRLRLDGGAQQGSGPLSLRALAAVARQPAGVRASRQVTAKRRSAIRPHVPRSPARSVSPTVAPVTAGVTVTPSGAWSGARVSLRRR